MDSLTHVVLGVALGEVCGRRQIGKSALILGAIAQSLPDIDFIAAVWASPSGDLLAHRAFTHSLLFIVCVAPLLSAMSRRWLSEPNFSFQQGLVFFALQLAVHDFIDALNAYGTGWFEPFSHVRISFHSLYVADPFFTLGPLLACLAIILLSPSHARRRTFVWIGIGWSVLYLGYAVSNKWAVEKTVKSNLAAQSIQYGRLLTTPMPLNSWLWWVVAEDDEGFHVGYRSRFDSEAAMDFRYFPRNNSLLRDLPSEDVLNLKRFSQNYYTIEQRGDTLVFNDLRFGQNGWDNPRAHFVFNYYLNYPDQNQMVVQRGRFAGWNRQTVNSFIRRIKGL